MVSDATSMLPRLQVTEPAPIPLDVICLWLRKQAARGVPIRISPLLAQRIAAELEGARHG